MDGARVRTAAKAPGWGDAPYEQSFKARYSREMYTLRGISFKSTPLGDDENRPSRTSLSENM